MITLEQFKKITGLNDADILKGINDTLKTYNINTPLRISHFMAQVMHESGNFKFVKENLNYSSAGLLKTFRKYFPTTQSTVGYARNPERIANKVYANRMGNGNEASGDGWKFRGRGYIQCTGKNNYVSLSQDTKLDFVNNPELLETLGYAAISAGWYWDKHKLNLLADKDNLLAITKAINGGTNGLDDRKSKLLKVKSIIGKV